MSRFASPSWLAGIVLIAACGGADSKAGQDTTSQVAAPAPVEAPKGPEALETATYAPSLGIDLAKSTKLASGMYIRDLTVGKGATAQTGMQVSTTYWGYYTDGNLFETNEKGPPVDFPLGTPGIIAGWNEGLVGMKVGGKRQLVIPSAQAYGAAGRGAIGPNTNLVFVVELLGAK